jgi:hypothetical protein
MRKLEVAAISALACVAIFFALQHPDLLSGRITGFSHSAVLPDHLVVRSIASDIIDFVGVVFGVAVLFKSIRRRLADRKTGGPQKLIRGGRSEDN